MSIVNQAEFKLGDMSIVYPLDTATRMIGLVMYPTALATQLAVRRTDLTEGPEYAHLPGWAMPAYALDPLLQVKWIGAEPTFGFGQGRTMRGSAATQTLKFDKQEVQHAGDTTTIVTTLRSVAGYLYEHRLSWVNGDAFVTGLGHLPQRRRRHPSRWSC